MLFFAVTFYNSLIIISVSVILLVMLVVVYVTFEVILLVVNFLKSIIYVIELNTVTWQFYLPY